jgi:ubiquinone/menaquinone biosynthesis C-methylase UbiE
MRRTNTPGGLEPPPTLKARYRPEALKLLTPREADELLSSVDPADIEGAASDPGCWDRVAEAVAWDLMYRLEPDLYERLIAGERLPPGVLDWLPTGSRVVEIGAGTGRLTVLLAARGNQVIAVEPAASMRRLLSRRLASTGNPQVEVRDGYFDDLPVPDAWADLVVACSAFTTDRSHGGDPGLREMERVCATGGLVAIVWPTDKDWFADRGFERTMVAGDMGVDYGSREEALEICSVFYPWAVDAVGSDGRLSYEVLGIEPPRDIVYRRKR